MENNKTKIITPKVKSMYWAFINGRLSFKTLTAFMIIFVDGNEVIGVEKDTYKKVKFVKNDNNEWWSPNDEFRLDVDNSMLEHLESLFD